MHMCDITHSYVWHDSFICATWLIHMCDMTHSCVSWLMHMCDLTHSHDLFIYVTWLIHMLDMTYSHESLFDSLVRFVAKRFHVLKSELSSSKVKYHRKFFIETPKFVVLRGFHRSRNESLSRATRSPHLVLRGFHNLRLISFAALCQVHSVFIHVMTHSYAPWLIHICHVFFACDILICVSV